MFGARFGDDPHGCLRLHGHHISEHLAQVVMVGFLQLVLDDDLSAALDLSDQVDVERPGRLFPFNID
ncbi:hypothetical protein D3C80_2023540 [compost metagenome]